MVGDNGLSHHQDDFPKKDAAARRTSYSRPKVQQPPQEFFVQTANYFEHDRKFLIHIEKDGLLPALHKLDAQLKEVRTFPISN